MQFACKYPTPPSSLPLSHPLSLSRYRGAGRTPILSLSPSTTAEGRRTGKPETGGTGRTGFPCGDAHLLGGGGHHLPPLPSIFTVYNETPPPLFGLKLLLTEHTAKYCSLQGG